MKKGESETGWGWRSKQEYFTYNLKRENKVTRLLYMYKKKSHWKLGKIYKYIDINIIIKKCSARTHPHPTSTLKKKEKSHVPILKNKITDYCQPPGQFSHTHTHAPSHFIFLWTYTARQSFSLYTLILMPHTLSPLTCSNGSC